MICDATKRHAAMRWRGANFLYAAAMRGALARSLSGRASGAGAALISDITIQCYLLYVLPGHRVSGLRCRRLERVNGS